jgi:hypothetical protein
MGGANKKDANQASSVTGKFAYYYAGHPFHEGYGGMMVRLDPRDGVVVYLSRSLTKIKVEASVAKLKYDEAVKLGQPIADRNKLGADRTRSGAVSKAKPSSLEYVRPNGMFGSPEYSREERPARFRLAWILRYPNEEEVWVDAGDGNILGGSKRDL